LRSGGGALFLEQGGATDHRDLETLEAKGFSVRDGLRKGDAVSAIDDVDSSWRDAELQDAVVGGEVLDADLERRERRAERSERGIHALGIVSICFHQDIEVLGSTRMTMERDGMAAQHDEASPRLVKLHEEIAKIVEELDHSRFRGTKHT
jgi:hypothetical protein